MTVQAVSWRALCLLLALSGCDLLERKPPKPKFPDVIVDCDNAAERMKLARVVVTRIFDVRRGRDVAEIEVPKALLPPAKDRPERPKFTYVGDTVGTWLRWEAVSLPSGPKVGECQEDAIAELEGEYLLHLSVFWESSTRATTEYDRIEALWAKP